MAGPNSSSAFVNIQAPQGSIADVINQQENLEFRYRQEERQDEQIRYQRQKDKEEWRDEFLKENLKEQDYINFDNVELNQHVTSVISGAQEEAGKVASEMVALKNSGKGSSPEYNRLFTKLHTLNQTSDVLKQALSPMSKLTEKVNNGDFLKTEGLISTLKNIRDAEVSFDENGRVSLVVKEADGSSRNVGYADMVKGEQAFGLIPKVNLDKMISETGKGLKTHTQKYFEGDVDITKKGIPEKFARESAQSMLYGSPKGTELTSTSISWLVENGYDYKNKETIVNVMQDLEDYVTEKLIRSQESEDTRDLDRTNVIAKANLNQRKAEHAHKVSQDAIDNGFKREELDSKNKEKTGGLFLSTTNNETYGRNKNVVPNSPSLEVGKAVSVGTIEVGGKFYNDSKVTSITYGKDGRAVVEIDYSEKAKGIDDNGNELPSERKKTTITVNKQTESRVANLLGTDVQTLRSQLKPKEEVTKEDLRNKYDY